MQFTSTVLLELGGHLYYDVPLVFGELAGTGTVHGYDVYESDETDEDGEIIWVSDLLHEEEEALMDLLEAHG